ncbi:hypothetical protein NSB25_13630 [Acetatifactor muris]|uniref:Cytidylate kinase n=1 Tax=Acetatifactor muris TaxID=879566 RepID=A0A2K4ZIA0_9FIRM|nr:hypothetical protein [Acetatifactor muris]MCR2048329.1 hypothetical protein [Acetatifactor muris]SOY30132.1 hypothetical protein AMURIS_02855 [Acetatifactor muris]
MKKTVIIINGNGGVGKDTLCLLAGRHFRVRNVSSVTPIKEIAGKYGGWNGEKDPKSRKFLADLKELFVNYNDLPFQYLCREYEDFMQSGEELMFAHIREGEEIEKLRNRIKTPCVTLLVTRQQNAQVSWGNASDDNVGSFHYDYVYANDRKLEEAEEDFCRFLREILAEEKA